MPKPAARCPHCDSPLVEITIDVDGAPLTIDHLDGFAVARVGAAGPVVLSTEDLRPEFNMGAKFTVGRRAFNTPVIF